MPARFLFNSTPIGIRLARTLRTEMMDCMDAQLVDTISYAGFSAEVYSTNLPGEFKVIYRDSIGNQLEEAPLTGISSYKQREPEIWDRLRQLREGESVPRVPDRGDAGEY